MTAHELVIRLGRPFDVRTESSDRPDGFFAFTAEVRVITIPFADRESAEAAQREIAVTVRPVHDAGGEDYRPAVAGEVVRTVADEEFGEALARATAAEKARAAVRAPEPGPPRDMNDWRG